MAAGISAEYQREAVTGDYYGESYRESERNVRQSQAFLFVLLD